jgi:hypothetical protein
MDGRVTRGPPVPAASGPVESTNAVASSSKLAAAPTTAATPELDTFALPAQLSKKAQKAVRVSHLKPAASALIGGMARLA